MSVRTNLPPQLVMTNASMAADITSSPTILRSLNMISYTIVWSGTSPVGTVSVQVSNDYSLNPDGTVNNAGHWVPYTLNQSGTPTTTIAVSGNTGTGFIDITTTAGFATRLIYTAGSGVGTMNVTVVGKV